MSAPTIGQSGALTPLRPNPWPSRPLSKLALPNGTQKLARYDKLPITNYTQVEGWTCWFPVPRFSPRTTSASPRVTNSPRIRQLRADCVWVLVITLSRRGRPIHEHRRKLSGPLTNENAFHTGRTAVFARSPPLSRSMRRNRSELGIETILALDLRGVHHHRDDDRCRPFLPRGYRLHSLEVTGLRLCAITQTKLQATHKARAALNRTRDEIRSALYRSGQLPWNQF